MCGLIAAIDTNKKKKPVNDKIIELYEEQYRRGEEGFGILTLDGNKKVKLDRATEPAKFMYDIHNVISPFILAHHRTPTSTENKLSQTHPILVENKWLKYNYYIMHNGIIRNCDELKKEHEEYGFRYTTEIQGKYSSDYYKSPTKFNDSESMAIELAMYIEGLKTTVNFEGSAAFLIMQVDKKTNKLHRFFYGRHINPLNIFRENGIVTIASEGPGVELEEDIIYETKNGEKPKQWPLIFPEKKIEIKVKAKTTTADFMPAIKPEEKLPTETTTKSCTIWTKEDQEEMDEYNAGYGLAYDEYPDDLTGRMESAYTEIAGHVDDFVIELEDEDTAMIANVEDTLILIKKCLKEVKGNAIKVFRAKKEQKDTEKKEEREAMGFKTETKVENNTLKLPFTQKF